MVLSGLHANHLKRVNEFQTPQGQAQFEQLVQQVRQHTDFILTAGDSGYPSQLLPYTDYPPIIFGKGQAQALLQPQIAIVGSRKPSPHGRQVAYDFAYYLSEKGFSLVVVWLMALMKPRHQGASTHQRTIAVTGTGLDTTYPAQNKNLQNIFWLKTAPLLLSFTGYTAITTAFST